MDEDATMSQDQAQLDDLEEEIQEARRHLGEMTPGNEHEPYLFEDDQEPEDPAAAEDPPG